MGAYSTLLVEMPTAVDAVLRITLLLSLAWGIHGLLARCNPRWRVQLWRLGSLAIIVVAASTFLPRYALVLDGQQDLRRNHRDASSTVAMSRSLAHGAALPAPSTEAPPVHEWSDSPLESFLPDETGAANLWIVKNAPSDGLSSMTSWITQNGVQLIIVVWAVGVLVLSIRWSIAQLQMRQMLSHSTPAPKCSARLLRRIADRLGIFGDFELRLSTQTDVPFVAGVLRPIVVLPARMAAAKFAREMPAIFAHELSHVKSHDLPWMGVWQWITMLLWFHPLAWRVTTTHALACEEVADAVAAKNVGDVTRYSGTLARVALAAVSHPPAAAAISMARSSQIILRLQRLQSGLSNLPLTRRGVFLSALAGVFACIPVATIKLAYADAAKDAVAATDDQQPGRVLHFPKNISVGMLYFATEKEVELWDKYSKAFDYRRDWDWKYAGQGQGDVTVPAGVVVKIDLKQPGAANMSWVKRLKPDDIYEFRVFPHPSNPHPYKFGDAQVRHLGHLTGLQELEMKYVHVTGRGLRALEPLKSLEKLKFYSPDAGNDSLRSFGKLTGLQSLLLGNGKWDDAGLAYLADLKDLEEVHLPFSGVPGKGFDAVLQLPNLKYIAGFSAFKNIHLARLKKSRSLRALNLNSNVTINDDSLRYIAQLPQLEYLDLYHTNITDAGLKHLRPLKSLKRLNIQVNQQGRNLAITDKGLAAVADLSELETLRLGSVGDADESLKLLSNLKNLKSLGMGGRRDTGLISDDGGRQLAKLHNLVQLTLWGTAFTDAGAAHLSQMTSLRSLSLQSSGITNDGLELLAKLQELEFLDLTNLQKRGGITTAGVSRLKGLNKLVNLQYGIQNPTPADEPLDFSLFPELQKLMIGRLRDEDLISLAKCEKLKRLELGLEGPITNEGLAHLAGLQNLEMLTIPGEGITDEGLVHLAGMEQLDMLTIRGHITDAGLRQLAKYKSLGSVNINTTERVSQAAMKQLHTSLPNLWMFSVNQNRAGIRRPKRKPMRSGKQAPPFQLTMLDGSETSLKDYRGKVLLLYFWSTNCKPCVASVPKLKKAYAQLSKFQDFAMISLSGDDNEPIWKNFVQKNKLSWPQARIGDNSKIATAYGVSGFPRYIVIGRDGTILTSVTAELDSVLRKALEVDDE